MSTTILSHPVKDRFSGLPKDARVFGVPYLDTEVLDGATSPPEIAQRCLYALSQGSPGTPHDRFDAAAQKQLKLGAI